MKFSTIITSTLGLVISIGATAQTDDSEKVKSNSTFSEKHAFDSKSCFIEVNGGRFFTQTKEVRGEDFFENQYPATWVTNLSFEKGLSKYYYLKGNLSYAQYSMKDKVNGANGASVFYPFQAVGLSAGFGKRIILKNNLNLVNLEAGVGINGHSTNKGLVNESFGAGRFTDTGDTVYVFNTKSYVDTKIFPTLYLGASKDILLVKALYLSIAYRFNLGVTSVARHEISYSDSQNTNTPTELIVNGTSHAVTLGVRYRFTKN